MAVVKRLKEYLDCKGITIQNFEIEIGYSNGAFGSQLRNNKNIGSDKLEKILIVYKDINPEWLLTGIGSMLKQVNDFEKNKSSFDEQEIKLINLQIKGLETENKLQAKAIDLYQQLNEEMKERIDKLEKELSNSKLQQKEPILYSNVAEPASELIKKGATFK